MNLEKRIKELETLLKSNVQNKKGGNEMTTENKTTAKAAQDKQEKKRASKVAYVYGQIYRGHLESGENTFTIQNIHVREWKNILFWLKKNQYIVNFKLGDTIETACQLSIEGFDSDNLIYEKYIEAVKRNMINETQEVA